MNTEKELMTNKILYVINKETTTSIPLEVAKELQKENCNLNLVTYYKRARHDKQSLDISINNIGAKHIIDLKAIINTFKLIKQEKPSLIHAHHSISALYFFTISKLISPSTCLIKTVHTSNNSFTWYQKVMNKLIYLMADKVICNSYSTLNSFTKIEQKICSSKSAVIYNGVNLKQIKNIKKNTKITDKDYNQDIVIGSVGRLIKVKDYETLIKSFDLLPDYIKNKAKLILIGDGKEKESLKSFVYKRKLDDKVIFTGNVKRLEVFKLLQTIDIFVITSLSEGFCNALVEALASKKAVVCSNIPTLREVAGNAALFAEVKNPKAFSKEILKLINDKELLKEMKNKSENQANKYSLEECTKQYMKQYDTCLLK